MDANTLEMRLAPGEYVITRATTVKLAEPQPIPCACGKARMSVTPFLCAVHGLRGPWPVTS